MRKIFSSQRVETAEGVAQLLRDAGIEVRVSNGRSYQSKRSGQFSYLEQGNAQNYPSVWVVHANDQARAREILRQARLLDTTRRDLPDADYGFAGLPGAGQPPRANWAWRIRIALLAVIGAIALFIALRHRAPPAPAAPSPPPVAAPAQPPQQAPQPQPPQQDEQEQRVRIEPTR
ncbi:putative signal transducing protein [[Pseudomonas] boreopolis]|uniref:Pathogenicity-like protein n=1 Tax=Xanthomonas boreopolis TaxID=86183 RepID=A0A919F700_9XANT|nr:pathogenicity-like protein [[Pseudomonas] boreopolis]